MDVVVIDRLTKDYGPTRALDGASWSMPRGCLLGFLGPNGAGKTTTIRILLGFMKATSGRAGVFGLDAWKASTAIRRRIGYLPGDVRLYGNVTGAQIVRFAARARAMNDLGDAPRLAGRLELDLNTRVRNCSKGMRQKLGLIIAMMHRPELLILDEPTASLDPLMQQALYHELRDAARQGRSVLFSSHSLAEVETLCESVVILRNGRVVTCRPVSDLRRDAAQKLRVRFAGEVTPASVRASAPSGLVVEECHNGSLKGRWKGRPDGLLAWLATLPVGEIAIHPPDLEDLFLGFYASGDAPGEDT